MKKDVRLLRLLVVKTGKAEMVNLLKTPFQNEKQFDVDKVVDEKFPEQFQVNRQRNMPVAKFFAHRGYYLFPSENSYDVFKQNGNEIMVRDAQGVGVPLLHITEEFPSLGKWAGNAPEYMVYRYILVPSTGPPLAVPHEIVVQGPELSVCKVPFCEIYHKWQFKDTEYRFGFPYEQVTTASCMVKRSFANRDLYTYVGDVSLRWHVQAAIVSNTDHYKLQLLDDSMPNLLDDSATAKRKKQLRKTRNPAEIAHYTRTYRDTMPHRNSKRANLYIGERSTNVSYGIVDVPWTTLVLACQGLLIHYIEHERREEREKNRKRNRR